MAIVAVYESSTGTGKAYICDDYFVKTKEEADQIMRNIADIYVRSQLKKRRKEFEASRQKELSP